MLAFGGYSYSGLDPLTNFPFIGVYSTTAQTLLWVNYITTTAGQKVNTIKFSTDSALIIFGMSPEFVWYHADASTGAIAFSAMAGTSSVIHKNNVIIDIRGTHIVAY